MNARRYLCELDRMCDNESGSEGVGSTARSLTPQLDLGERGLAMKATRQALLERIMRRVEADENGCWIWHGACDGRGYSSIWDGERVRVGHRLVWELSGNDIPEGMTLDHLCFVTRCVNPGHLRVLSRVANSRNQRRTFQTRCVHGHELDDRNTYRTGRRRICRECNRLAVARRRERLARGASA